MSSVMARRTRAPQSWAWSLALALVVIGFISAGQWNGSALRRELRTDAQQVLAQQAADLEIEQQALRTQIETLESRVREAQTAAEGSQAALAGLNEQVRQAELAAGLTPVVGPGIVAEIADSKRPVPAGEDPARYLVLVDDLRDLVAALWAAGAEAISINGERLTARTSVSGAGASILINVTPYSPPYRIEAIGAPGLLERYLADPTFAVVNQRIEAYGLEFATVAEDEVHLPAYVGLTGFTHGRAVPEEQ